MTLCVRAWNKDDVAQIVAIEKLVQLTPWSDISFYQCMQLGFDGFVIGADTILGFAITSILHGECHLLNLGVLPDFQHQGLGTQLLRHLLDAASQKQANVVYLEVRSSNQQAIQFYIKMGFTKIGVRKNYYRVTEGHENAEVYAFHFVPR